MFWRRDRNQPLVRQFADLGTGSVGMDITVWPRTMSQLAAKTLSETGSTSPEISVVMPCHNAAATIELQLEALSRQSWNGTWEVVVSDNGSTDESIARVLRFRHRLPGLRVVDSSGKPGAAHARNVGAVAARGRSLLFCDADDVVGAGWLAAMATALRQHAFVAGMLEFAELNPKGLAMRCRPDGLFQTTPPFLPFAFGGALGVRREAHLEVGGFDEEFNIAAEDVEYCLRLQLRGVPLRPVHDAVIHYRLRGALVDVYRQARHWARGDVRLYCKFRSAGMRRPSQLRAVRYWLLWVPRLVRGLRSPGAFRVFVWAHGRRVGFLKASIEHRVFAL